MVVPSSFMKYTDTVTDIQSVAQTKQKLYPKMSRQYGHLKMWLCKILEKGDYPYGKKQFLNFVSNEVSLKSPKKEIFLHCFSFCQP